MKALYYLSWVLSAPFWLVSWTLYGLAWVSDFAGCWVHDQTTYRAWGVLHRRECDKIFKK